MGSKRNSKMSSPIKRKTRVKSHYRMRGMGHLLSMYGGAGESLETSYNEKRTNFLRAREEFNSEKDKLRREQLREVMEHAKVVMNSSKEKMKALLKGVTDAASKAIDHLNATGKQFESKLLLV